MTNMLVLVVISIILSTFFWRLFLVRYNSKAFVLLWVFNGTFQSNVVAALTASKSRAATRREENRAPRIPKGTTASQSMLILGH